MFNVYVLYNVHQDKKTCTIYSTIYIHCTYIVQFVQLHTLFCSSFFNILA